MIEIPPLKWSNFNHRLSVFFEEQFPAWIPFGVYPESEMALHVLNFLDKPKNFLTQSQVVLALRKRGLSANGLVTVTPQTKDQA